MKSLVRGSSVLFAALSLSFAIFAEDAKVEAKIRNAMMAAPMAIAKDATVLDYPTDASMKLATLRKGTNGWTCLPDDSNTPSNDPLCVDSMGMKWIEAFFKREEPDLPTPGIGYMLLGGGSPSNTDPFATKPAAGEEWMKEPPHIMIFPSKRFEKGTYSTDHHAGGPWVMYAGTPYEHFMIPVGEMGH
jgi:hypothetical protein